MRVDEDSAILGFVFPGRGLDSPPFPNKALSMFVLDAFKMIMI